LMNLIVSKLVQWYPASRSPLTIVVLVTAVLPLLGGCGGQGDDVLRFDVAGTVSHGGQPVPAGYVQFMPDSTQGNSGPSGGAPIEGGKFDTAVSGQGVVGGAYVVRVSGYDGNAKPENELPFGMPLFPEYSTKVVFPKAAHNIDFEVPK
ncbi:MAG: hypothetical protein ACKN9U_17815, partial [Pirellulaceae bacterium]